jgi:hypothetical protein
MATDSTLHIGKLTEELKTTVTPDMHDLVVEKARTARCNPSDLLRDALYLVLTGETFAAHVANDRRTVLSVEVRQVDDNKTTRRPE